MSNCAHHPHPQLKTVKLFLRLASPLGLAPISVKVPLLAFTLRDGAEDVSSSSSLLLYWVIILTCVCSHMRRSEDILVEWVFSCLSKHFWNQTQKGRLVWQTPLPTEPSQQPKDFFLHCGINTVLLSLCLIFFSFLFFLDWDHRIVWK